MNNIENPADPALVRFVILRSACLCVRPLRTDMINICLQTCAAAPHSFTCSYGWGGRTFLLSCDCHLEEEHDAKRSGKSCHVRFWFCGCEEGIWVFLHGGHKWCVCFRGSKAFGSCSDEANERPVKTKRQALFCCLARFLSHGGFPWARCDPTSSVTALQFFLLLNSFLQKLYFKTCRRLSEIVCFQAQHRSETSRLKKKKGNVTVQKISAPVTQTSGKWVFIRGPVSWRTSDYNSFLDKNRLSSRLYGNQSSCLYC